MLMKAAFLQVTRGGLCRCLSTGSAAIQQPLHYLDGKRIQPTNPNPKDDIEILYPATGEVLCTTRSSDESDVDKAVKSAKAASKTWSQVAAADRGQILLKASRVMWDNIEEIAKVEVYDTGKPIWEARMDIECCASNLEYLAGLAPTIAGEHVQQAGGSFFYTRPEPLGVVGAIGAWNFPYQMTTLKVAPALVTGNTVVFKPSPFTPMTAVMMAEIYKDVGLPDGVYNVVQGGAATGQHLCVHPDIAKTAFTGSVATGLKIMQACASKEVKHVTLELGGKSPLIIFEDADIENAVKGAMMANFMSQGQVCSNGTRVFVHESVMDKFLKLFVEKTNAMKIGDPMAEDTKVGATNSQEQAEKVLRYIEGAKKDGCRILCGGERVTIGPEFSKGYFISPCIVADVKDDMSLARDEVFGSVVSVFSFKTEEEVVRRANDTYFGLTGGVFTRDINRAHRVASQIESGFIYINTYNMFPNGFPVGGFKQSGLGRENSAMTLNEYMQIKSVYVEAGDVWCPY